MNIKKALLLASLLAGISSVNAADFDFNGTFTDDNDIVRFNFTVGAQSNVTVFSSSWVAGGFDPILAIWTAGGTQMSQQDDGHVVGSTLSNGVSYSHGTWDSYYSVNLGAGNYIATVAQFDNFSVSANLANGFRYDNNPNFTFDLGYGAQPLFNGVWGGSRNDPRTGAFAFHILNVAQATQENVPDSASTALLSVLGLAGLVIARRRLS